MQGSGGSLSAEDCKQELTLTEKALRKNPKAYQAWHHRRWAVIHGQPSLEHEMALITQCVPRCGKTCTVHTQPHGAHFDQLWSICKSAGRA